MAAKIIIMDFHAITDFLNATGAKECMHVSIVTIKYVLFFRQIVGQCAQ